MQANFGSNHRQNDEVTQASQTMRARLIIALWEFVNCPTWDDALRFLGENAVLLTADSAVEVVRWLVGELGAAGRADEASYWEVHLHVLEDVRAHGLDAVRAYFEQMRLLPPRHEV